MEARKTVLLMLSGTFEVFVKIIKNHAAADHYFFLNKYLILSTQRGSGWSDPIFRISY